MIFKKKNVTWTALHDIYLTLTLYLVYERKIEERRKERK